MTLMNCTLMPSLEYMALVKIAITLLSQDDIRALMAGSYDLSRVKEEKWEDKVIEKVLQLPLPEPFKKEILDLIKPISSQIFKWGNENTFLGIHVPGELCWTPQGTVDKKKTAEVLIKAENLDTITRYKLACIYCLEDDIPVLWNTIPEHHKRSFYIKEEHELVVFWTCNIKGEVDKLDNRIQNRLHRECSPYQYAFEYAAVDGNKAATEYFLQKLTSKEREESLIRSAGDVAEKRSESSFYTTDICKAYTDVLCFLLSQMNEKQQIEVFKNHYCEVLQCLLDWPWQSLFMEMANRMWDFFLQGKFHYLLHVISLKMTYGCKDYNYQKLFGEVWKQSPYAVKKLVLDKEMVSVGYLVAELLKFRDEENVRLILKSTTAKQKEFIFLYNKLVCRRLVYNNKWDSLKFFVQQCKEVMIKFREELETEMWSKCFHCLDDLTYKDGNKRSLEECESSPPKRLHSAEFEEVTHSIEK